MENTEYTTGTKRGEGMLPKARRLVAAGAVKNLGDGKFTVEGDSAVHHLRFSKNPERPDLDCSCKRGGFGDQTCSHRLATELFLSNNRKRAA